MIDQIECTGELRILDWQDAELFYGESLFCQTAGDHRKPLSPGHSLQNRVGTVADPFGTDMDAPVLQFRFELFPGAAARFPQHKGLAFQVCHGDLCPAAERVPLGTDQHQFVPEHRAGEKIRLGHIAFHQAEADFRRIKALYADKLVTQRDYLAAEAEYLRAKAEYDPVKVSDEKGTLIQAPAAGYVSQLSVAPGDYVEMGQPLATIAKSGRMQLRAMVSQRYFSLLPSLTDATFRTPASDACYRVSELGGRLYTSGKIIPEGSSLVPVVFEFVLEHW